MGVREHTLVTHSGDVLHPNQLMAVTSWCGVAKHLLFRSFPLSKFHHWPWGIEVGGVGWQKPQLTLPGDGFGGSPSPSLICAPAGYPCKPISPL
ncbi:MAG: hypothetical protein Q6367_007990, partial [Candidatus Freyarchaeota archaeon]